ncbi:hypothetical protein OE88DRAFT_1661232 [Heliocybe sulcata]|uniref:Uncharacterized protein n=1 Tax=Heliocybe sulcata TaxID=5364 RepID=A0A5C3N2L8_9AGAM|nr:hypothetical protein OE88DRAFT_1661232 [Heliocybe sulcata]
MPVTKRLSPDLCSGRLTFGEDEENRAYGDRRTTQSPRPVLAVTSKKSTMRNLEHQPSFGPVAEEDAVALSTVNRVLFDCGSNCKGAGKYGV